MRKFMDVDIIDALAAIMERNTKSYKTDFEYDKTRLLEAAASPGAEDKALIWMSRTNGTWCFNERDSLIAGTDANTTWLHYDGAGESILDFSVVILGAKDGCPVGNLYQLDYDRHLQLLKRDALPAETVSLTFDNGKTGRFPFHEFKRDWQGIQRRHGSLITQYRFEVQDESALQSIIDRERRLRNQYPPKSLNAYLKIISKPAAKPSVTEKLEMAKQAVKPPSAEKTAARGPEL